MKLIPFKQENSLARPFGFFGGMGTPFESIFDDFFAPLEGDGLRSNWLPSLDVRETKDSMTVMADLPGLEKKDIEVSIENGTLRISGERKLEEEKKEHGWRRVERSFGSFSRSLSLPAGIDEKDIKADYKDGVLTVHLTKTESAKARTITVH